MSLNLGLLSVELPGIEPAAGIGVTCGNIEIDDAKTTRKYVKRPANTREMLMASTPGRLACQNPTGGFG